MTKLDQNARPRPLIDSSELSPAAFARLARFITGELGIKMPESKLTIVQSRLQKRVRELGMQSVDEYAEYFMNSTSGEEREHLINAVTTNKTDFFREPEHFTYLVEQVLPGFTADPANRGRRFHAWSAGCSSGEEPYTLAMVLAEYAECRSGFDFAILATDVSTQVLECAQTGIYQEAQIAPVPPDLRRKYLLRSRSRSDPRARVVPHLRSKVSFHQLNFMAEDYAIRAMFDVVFFRNVMLYFDRKTQETVINRISRNLVPGGYLFTSHAETLAGLNVPLRSLKAAAYRKIETARAAASGS